MSHPSVGIPEIFKESEYSIKYMYTIHDQFCHVFLFFVAQQMRSHTTFKQMLNKHSFIDYDSIWVNYVGYSKSRSIVLSQLNRTGLCQCSHSCPMHFTNFPTSYLAILHTPTPIPSGETLYLPNNMADTQQSPIESKTAIL